MHRSRIIVALLFALVALAIAVGWSERRPIATHFVDRELARRGVPARYRIARLGVYAQRLEDVRIGDPAHPDLVADRIDLRLSYGLSGPRLRAVDARGVRLHGRIVDGRLSLGSIDRLLPSGGGAPFALPDLDLRTDDAQVSLDTPAGPVALVLAGRGNLADGFRGRLLTRAPVLAVAGCRLSGIRTALDVTVAARRPSFEGPVTAEALRCDGWRVSRLRVTPTLALSPALDRWTGSLGFGADEIESGTGRVARLTGSASIEGTAAGSAGRLQARTGPIALTGGAASRATADLRYALAGERRSVEGTVAAVGAKLDPRLLASAESGLNAAAGTPVAPLAETLVAAARAAIRDFSGQAQLTAVQTAVGTEVTVSGARLASPSGAWLRTRDGAFRWASATGAPGSRFHGIAELGGGGFPDARLTLDPAAPAAPDAPTSGRLELGPFAAGGARLALTPVHLSNVLGTVGFRTTATIDGPLGDGRVERLTLPLDGRFSDGRLTLNPRCAPLGFAGLDVAGMRLGETRLSLCPTGSALVSADGFGARMAAPRLAGRIGASPLSLAARELRAGASGLEVTGLDARIGSANGAVTQLAAERIDGRFAAGGIGGRFAGLQGTIANVPLRASDGAGEWRVRDGVLDLTGALGVADADPNPRFAPLRAPAMTLRMADGTIRAAGSLVAPASGTRVTDVTIVHRLSTGAGRAELDVPELRFTEALQPEALTRLTLGVVANVRGAIGGKGWIAWDAGGVTSGGRFRTESLDLAAAFGPVSGLAGEIQFSDLLGFVTPPGQVATIASVNPGIAVAGGVVRYQLLPGFQLAIEGGKWPFSGGELVLDPTLLDFSEAAQRRLTFRVTGMDAAEFVEQFGFENIAVTGIFDGVVPMIFDKSGGRIEKGRLAVRSGGGTLAYVGPVSNAQLGTFGKLAFDALKSMRYDRLALELDGALDGEIVSRVLFDGTNETPIGQPATKAGFLSRISGLSQLTGLPFRFRITIRAPFRGLLNSAEAFNDPRGLISRSVPAEQASPPGAGPIQPQESEVVR